MIEWFHHHVLGRKWIVIHFGPTGAYTSSIQGYTRRQAMRQQAMGNDDFGTIYQGHYTAFEMPWTGRTLKKILEDARG